MGAHALGSAAYAVRAASLAAPDRPGVATDELDWQLTHMTADVGPPCRPFRLSAKTGQALSVRGFSHRGDSARLFVSFKPVSQSRLEMSGASDLFRLDARH